MWWNAKFVVLFFAFIVNYEWERKKNILTSIALKIHIFDFSLAKKV